MGQIFSMPKYPTIQRGSLYEKSFRLFFQNMTGDYISPIHDIPAK
jgi:hypothetical protein